MSDALFAEARKRAQGIVRELHAMAEREHITDAERATLILAAAEIDGAVEAFQGVVEGAQATARRLNDVLGHTTGTAATTMIWSGEWKAWWRRGENGGGNGYTVAMDEAGRWTRPEAERMIRHAGPEKRLQLILAVG